MKKLNYVLLILIVLMIGIMIGKLTSDNENNKSNDLANERELSITIPGVNNKGQGVTGTLKTTIKSGSGLILVNINNILAGYDTQYSARTAAHAASNYTNINLDNLDITYSIKTDSDLISGPSAGSAFAVSTMALLENRSINSSVSITGTINEDGSIGMIGSVPEKSDAIEKANLQLLLIPKGSIKGIIEREKTCLSSRETEYCEIRYVEKINETQYGIHLKEVSNIREAMEYFYNEEEN